MPNITASLAAAVPGLPEEGWWLALFILVLLGAAALIDALTARVPDPLIFLGLVITTAAQGFLSDWPFAARHLAEGLAALFLLWVINQIWYRLKRRDAIGMGDAKWTMLAVSCFGAAAGAFAWLFGAWLALGWLGLLRVMKRRSNRVYFAPFLFIALLIGIYWLRLR